VSALPDSSLIVGLTSTVPVEVIFASGLKPLDLNNLFVTARNRERLLNQAEVHGFAHNICAWIKGIYSSVLAHDIQTVIAVTGGDCSNTLALAEVLERRGIQVIPFHYPLYRDRESLCKQIDGLRQSLGATWSGVQEVKRRTDRIRRKLGELDRLTYEDGLVTGFENHLFLVTSSDFGSDMELYESRLDHFLEEARQRAPMVESIRLGYLGVPPILDGMYEFLEMQGARVVFNEVQRQFSLPYEHTDMVEQYLKYTYPYGIAERIEDVQNAIEERSLDGLIHYTQTFCFRQIYDIIFRKSFSVPFLTIEGDRPGNLDSRTQIRLETFVEMLKIKKMGFPED
jgi:benzoyl-CoA reductase/2-hydroxyglutaryl-CoA dehydratase subunit BcrC/BadD/HgdB